MKLNFILVLLCILMVVTFCSDDKPRPSSCRKSPVISTVGAESSYVYNTTGLNGSDFIVMTRNLYLGADITILLRDSNLSTIFQNTGKVFNDIVKSEFPRRAKGIAREIEQIGPDIIALQEVVTIYTGISDFIDNPVKNADCTEYDFLEILLTALEEKDLEYKAAVISVNADNEFTDTTKDIRLVDSDVILVKSNIETWDAKTTIFDNNLAISFLQYSVEIIRSYSEVMVKINNNSLKVFNTHLEVPDSVDSSTNEAQAGELIERINELSGADYPVIVTGDFNADPDSISYAHETYSAIAAVANDAWTVNSPSDGYTCCYSDGLNDEPGVLTWRIDHVFFINGSSVSLNVIGSIITEQDINERIIKTDGSKIWSSDHTAVAAGFAFQE